MANIQHIIWLREGSYSWNNRRDKRDFAPDFTNANFAKANLEGVNFSYANLRGANLSGANLRGANLEGAKLENTVIRTASKSLSIKTGDVPVFADLRNSIGLTLRQAETMKGDTGVILPIGMQHPSSWPDWLGDFGGSPDAEQPTGLTSTPKGAVVAITAPAEFNAVSDKIDVALTPVNPTPRYGSSTPINEEVRDGLVKSVEEMAKTLRENLEAYESEDTNRVNAAQQLAKAARTIQSQAATGGKRLLIPMFYRMVEATARAHVEDAHALETIDREMFTGLIDMARQVYAFYPALAEANDPNNTHRVPDNPGVTSDELISRLRTLFFSEETREHFTDKTRELFEAEVAATTPEGTDAEKFRIARFGALAGEVVREMRHRAERAKSELPSRELTGKWIAASMTAEAIWSLVAPFLGL